MLRSFEANCLQ